MTERDGGFLLKQPIPERGDEAVNAAMRMAQDMGLGDLDPVALAFGFQFGASWKHRYPNGVLLTPEEEAEGDQQLHEEGLLNNDGDAVGSDQAWRTAVGRDAQHIRESFNREH